MQGLAVAQDDEHQANAVVGPHMVTDPARADADGLTRLTAITRLHCVVIARRDLNGLLAMAPTLARRLTSAADTTPYGAVRRAQTRAPRGRAWSAIEQKSRGASNGSNVDRSERCAHLIRGQGSHSGPTIRTACRARVGLGATGASSDGFDALAPFLPRVVQDWLADEPEQLWREVEATVVFVDVSGFTRLSERLARLGRVGAEQLTDVIGSCFADLLEVVYAEGGGLLKFGGDALLLLFTGAGHAERGCRAAIGMRSRLRDVGRVDTAGGRVRLRMSVGVNSGRFLLCLVGASHREFVITGPAATETVLMEGTADAGEIVVSHATARVADGGARRRERPGCPAQAFAGTFRRSRRTRGIAGRR